MLKVGLTGGYASGKSLVANQLALLGCHVIYADALGHQVLLPDGAAYQPVVDLFGREILDTNGFIIRKKLGAIVFRNPPLLEKLNSIVHPAVFRLEEMAMAEFAVKDPAGIAVLEAAILIESRAGRHWDKLIVTSCRLETQIARAVARDHVTREEALLRIERQMPDSQRLAFADYVINTEGTREDTVAQVNVAFGKLRQLAEQNPF